MAAKGSQPSAKHTDGWAFNLRTFDVSYASDHSDSDDGPQSDGISKETKLIKDLDLSSRQETVVFKPNPFNIAKINAASRSISRTSGTAPISTLRRKATVKKGNGSILDGFKKQAGRAPHIPSTDGTLPLKPSSNKNRPTRHTLKPLADSIRAQTARNSPNIPIHQLSQLPISVSGPGSNGAHISTQVQLAMSGPMGAEVARVVDSSRPVLEPLGLRIQPEPGAPEGPHISRPDPFVPRIPPPIVQNRPRPRHRPHPFSSSAHPRSLNKSFLFASPIQSHSRTLLGNFQLYEKPIVHHSDETYFSSPIRSSHNTLTASVKRRPITFKPHSPFPAAHKRFLSPPFTYRNQTGSTVPSRFDLKNDRDIREDNPPPFPKNDQVFPENPDEIPNTLSQSLHHENPMDRRLTQSHLPAHNENSVYDDQSCETTVQRPREQVNENKTEHYSPSNKPDTVHRADHIILKRSRSPSPRNNPRTPPKKWTDAYAYTGQNLDEEWSTLPARKKTKLTDVKGTNKIRTSGKFRLPSTLLPPQTNKTGMSASSTRRVVTFMPPPLAKEERELNGETCAPRHAGIAAPKKQIHPESRNSPVAQPYPSPKFSSPTIDEVRPLPPPPHHGQRIPAYHPPSPPTSDPPDPIIFDTNNQMVPVDLDTIKKNYSTAKAQFRR